MAADIFFDVDGCLVDTQYNANLNEGVMKSAVEELIEDG